MSWAPTTIQRTSFGLAGAACFLGSLYRHGDDMINDWQTMGLFAGATFLLYLAGWPMERERD